MNLEPSLFTSTGTFEKHLQKLENAAEEISQSSGKSYLHIPRSKKESFVTTDPEKQATHEEVEAYVNHVFQNIEKSYEKVDGSQQKTGEHAKDYNQIRPDQFLRFFSAIKKINDATHLLKTTDEIYQDLIGKSLGVQFFSKSEEDRKSSTITKIIDRSERRNAAGQLQSKLNINPSDLEKLSLKDLKNLKGLVQQWNAKKLGSKEFINLSNTIDQLTKGEKAVFTTKKHLRHDKEVKTNIKDAPTLPTNFNSRSKLNDMGLHVRSGKDKDISVATHLRIKGVKEEVIPLTDYEKAIQKDLDQFDHLVRKEVFSHISFSDDDLKEHEIDQLNALFENVLRLQTEKHFVKDEEGKLSYKIKDDYGISRDQFISIVQYHFFHALDSDRSGYKNPDEPRDRLFDTITTRQVVNVLEDTSNPKGSFLERVFTQNL